MLSISRIKNSFTYRLFCLFVAFSFFSSMCILPLNVNAQTTVTLPAPGTMITPSIGYTPPIVAGITIYPDNPLQFDFIIDTGDDNLQGEALRNESKKLINYFLATLTVPEDEMWVNLSPYEKDRIIADGLGITEMGRDMLAQDYMLKQLTASLMYPEEEVGNKFWKKIYEKTQARFGTTEVPTNTFNKIWIVPEKAVVYVNGTNVFVSESHLKVLLEEDYLAMESNMDSNKHGLGEMAKSDIEKLSEEAKEVIREVIIPEIEREVNEGKNFANLRQIYHSMILATWYKKNLKEGMLGKIYADTNKISGIELEDKMLKEEIYNQYIKAFKVGVFDYIKEEYDPLAQEIVPRKYFSGGLEGVREAMISENSANMSPRILSRQKERYASGELLQRETVQFNLLTQDNSMLADKRLPDEKSAKTGNELARKLLPWIARGLRRGVNDNARDILGDRDYYVYLELIIRKDNQAIQSVQAFADYLGKTNISQISGEDLVRWLQREGFAPYKSGSEIKEGEPIKNNFLSSITSSRGRNQLINNRPSFEAQEFWGFALLDEDKIMELQLKHAEIKSLEDRLQKMKEQILEVVESVKGRVRAGEYDFDLFDGLYTQGGISLSGSYRFETVQQKVDEIMRILRERPPLESILRATGENYWQERFALEGQIQEAYANFPKEGFAVARGSNNLTPVEDFYSERIVSDLLSHPLSDDHFFNQVLKEEVSDYGDVTISEKSILRLLNAFGVNTAELNNIDNPGDYVVELFNYTKPLLEQSDGMPTDVRATFRQIIASYLFRGGTKNTPFPRWEDSINISAEDFIKIMEDQAANIAELINPSDNSMLGEEGEFTKGGIDFNPNMLDLNQGGQTVNFVIDDAMLENFQSNSLQGIRPVIINIEPIVNYMSLLGMVYEDEDLELSQI